MENLSQWNKWIIPHFSTICDEVCSKTFEYDYYDIELSAKNFKYLFFPFCINIKLKYKYESKKKKKVKAKVSFIICNIHKKRHLFIEEQAIFKSPNYEYTIKTKLTQDKLCNLQNGWVNSDSIRLKFCIEFIKPRYYHYDTGEYDEEESESENSFFSNDRDSSSSENDDEEAIYNNYYDFIISGSEDEKTPILKFQNFEMILASFIKDGNFAINFSFRTCYKMTMIFTFKVINFNYPPNESEMQIINIRSNPNEEPYIKQHELVFPISDREICDDEEGWLDNNRCMQVRVNFYYPKSKEDSYQYIQKKYNTHYSRNYRYDHYEDYNSYNSNSRVNYNSYYHDNSKEETGCVGLQNQGATCYMNSILQSLFHIPAFRKIVYKMPISDQEDLKTSIPLSLQRLFAKLQFSDESCSTKELTTSFGWNDRETFTQHDVQEFCTVLLSKLSDKMKGTPLENSLSLLLAGEFKSYIRCVNVDFESSKTEEFYDLSMIVKDIPNLEQSFKTYIEPEQMNGDNQYKTDQYGPQDAIMGTEFIQFPPVLHIHLRRFQFDYQTMRNIKINDKFEFPLTIDLKPYMADDQNSQSQEQAQEGNQTKEEEETENSIQKDEETVSLIQKEEAANPIHIEEENKENDGEQHINSGSDDASKSHEEIVSDYIYDLYGVLVHSGSVAGGHYFAFLRTSTSPQWYKFNDSNVSKATLNEAVEDNFGGSSYGYYSEKSYSAYMLVYIRRNLADEIMKPVSEDEIPSYLIKYAKGNAADETDKEAENASEETKKSEEKSKTIKINLNDDFGIFINSIFSQQEYANSKLMKTMNLPTVSTNEEQKEVHLNHQIIYDEVAKFIDVDQETIRLWLFSTSPYSVYKNDSTNVYNDINLFVQHKSADSDVDLSISSANGGRNIIFMKFFNPCLDFPFNFIGTIEIKDEDPISSTFPFLRQKIGLNEDDEDDFLVFYQYPSYFQKLDPSNKTKSLCQVLVYQLQEGKQLPENCPFPFIKREDIIKDDILQYADEKCLKKFEIEYGIKYHPDKSNESDASSYSILDFNIFKYDALMGNSKFQTVQEYYTSNKEIVFADLYDYNDPFQLNPFARICFQPSILLSDLKSFVARVIQITTGISFGFKDNDYSGLFNSIQIFKSANKSQKNHEPSTIPIKVQQGVPDLSAEFRVNSYYHSYNSDDYKCQKLFLQTILGIPEIVTENELVTATVLIAENESLINKYKVFQIFGVDNGGSKIGENMIHLLQIIFGDEKTEDSIITIHNSSSGIDENENNENDDENQKLIHFHLSNESHTFNDDASSKTGDDSTNKNDDDSINKNGDDSINKNGDDSINKNGDDSINKNGEDESKNMISNEDSSKKEDDSTKNGDDEIGKSNENEQSNSHIDLPDEIGGIPLKRIIISQIKNNIITRRLSPYFHIDESIIIRLDVINEEDLALIEDGAFLVPVSHINEDDMLTFGHPFFVVVSEDEKFESVKKKLNDYLVGNEIVTSQEFMHLSFFFSCPQQLGYSKKLLWKDMNVLSEMRAKESYSSQNVVLFILHKTKKNVDMSVKIYN